MSKINLLSIYTASIYLRCFTIHPIREYHRGFIDHGLNYLVYLHFTMYYLVYANYLIIFITRTESFPFIFYIIQYNIVVSNSSLLRVQSCTRISYTISNPDLTFWPLVSLTPELISPLLIFYTLSPILALLFFIKIYFCLVLSVHFFLLYILLFPGYCYSRSLPLSTYSPNTIAL